MAERIVGPLNALIDTCRQLRVPIIFTQHGHPDLEAEEATSVLVRWWSAAGSIRQVGAGPGPGRACVLSTLPCSPAAAAQAACALPRRAKNTTASDARLTTLPQPRRYGSPAWHLLPELHRQPGDHIIDSKRTYDAFQVGQACTSQQWGKPN